MAAPLQFDPYLKQLLLVTTGSPLGEQIPEEVAAREVPVVARLVDPAQPVDGLNVVSRFGPVVTGRIRLDQIVAIRQHPNVASLKRSAEFGSTLAVSIPEIRASPEVLRDVAPPAGITGRGAVIGFADWGCDFAHLNLRTPQGSTRLLCLWDQRGGPQPDSPQPFGYGRLFSRDQIDAALAQPDPYAALGYDPADSDQDGTGTHCTHVMDIAAGNGQAPGSSPGVAPEADLVCVHLKGDDTRPQDTLGDSVRVLEALQFILDCAGDRPVVINLSLGKTGGPHDPTPLVTQALDALLDERPGRAIVMSTGNYFAANIHSHGQLHPGEQVDLHWNVAQRQEGIVEMEVWYPGVDQLAVELLDPAGISLGMVARGEDCVVRDGERIIASIYHRQHDPNNRDHQADIFLWPEAASGTWTTRLHGEEVQDGRYHAWIERTRPAVQARFEPDCATPTHTSGTICNGYKTISVGAYDARQPSFPLGPFSSAGPTRDGRPVPVLSAPGVGIRAARSSSPLPDGRLMNGLTVKSGSSMAAPHVSGTAALMFQAAGDWRLTAEETRAILVATARPEPTDLEYGRYGAGRVDAAAAVQQVLALKRERAQPALAHPMVVAEKGPMTVEAEILNGEVPETSQTVPHVEGESCDERFLAVGLVEDAPSVLSPLQRKLAPILPALMVEAGDAELHRLDEAGNPVYDKSQPLLFGPNGRTYTAGPGRFHYHAADFVYNTAYGLGYDVPVYPPNSPSAGHGQAFLNLAATFDALVAPDGNALHAYLERFFEVIARPGETAPATMRAGDLLLRGAQSDADYGHLAIVVHPQLRDLGDSFFLAHDPVEGKGVHCISAGLAIRDSQTRYGCALADVAAHLLPNRMVIRFRDSAIDPQRASALFNTDAGYQRRIEHAHWVATLREEEEAQPEQEPAEAAVDATVAVPAFTAAKRAAISTTLLSPADNAAAIVWNASKHPGVSGVTPDEIRAALASYVELAAVSTAIASYNTAHSSAPIVLGTPPVDAVLVEALHQFQIKCFAESSQQDGKAGESTLDSLGFVRRTGMNSVDTPNSRAQARLNHAATAIQAATGGDLTAANWFQNMVNPSFLGRRFSHGIHLVLARKLRLAENDLLAKSAYSGMTPVELGRALAIDEEHKGARPSAATNSMHTFGLAVDVRYSGNPWVAGQHVDRDASGTPTAGGLATQTANAEFTQAVNHAALLISGVTVNFTPAYLSSLRTNPTATIYDTLAQRDADLRAYLRLNNNLAAIEAHIASRRAAGTPGVLNAGETDAAAAARWQTIIAADLANLRRADSNFSGRNPLNGFLNLNRDLVVALRDVAGLAWGAVDFGGECGDMMHFDDRLSGVGRVAYNSH